MKTLTKTLSIMREEMHETKWWIRDSRFGQIKKESNILLKVILYDLNGHSDVSTISI